MRPREIILGVLVCAGCKGTADPPAPDPVATPAQVVAETSATGDVRLYSGTIADLDGDGTLELAAGGFATTGGRRRATVFVYRQAGEQWEALVDGGWLGGGGGNGSTVRNVEVADLDGDGRPELIALGRVGSKSKEASARLAVLSLKGGGLVERARIEWNVATAAGEPRGERAPSGYTHGFGLALGDLDGDARPEIVTTGFLFDGTTEHGFVRTWRFDGALALVAETRLPGDASARINDVAIGDVDGDGRIDIVTVGRTGPYVPDGVNDDLSGRRERGDIAWFDAKTLELRARASWREGSSLRLRAVAIANLDGAGPPEIVVGGQCDGAGKPCLAVFEAKTGALVRRASAAGDVTGEIKDVLVADGRIIATGPHGKKGERQGDLSTWTLAGTELRLEREVVSSNGLETRARAAVLRPDGHVMTIGHAKNGTAMVGQLLDWPVSATAN